MNIDEVLELLAAALTSIDGDFVRRNRVMRLRGSQLGVVISELSVMERETMDVVSVRLIAMGKQVLTGRQTSDAFVLKCRAVIGV